MNTLDWFQNDELFYQELAKGKEFERKVSEFFWKAGIDSTVDETPWSDDFHTRQLEKYRQKDLVVHYDFDYSIEVKSRNLKFAGPEDFPFTTAIIDTKSGWNAKHFKPYAVILISQITYGMCVVMVDETQKWWKEESIYDTVRNIGGVSYTVARYRLTSFEDLVERIKQNAANQSFPNVV